MVGVGGTYTYAQPYGTVTLDVNPSIEYTINCFDRVLSAQAVNEDGAELLADLDLGTLRHCKIGDAISRTLTQIDDAALVVVGANTHSGAHSIRLKEELEAKLVPELEAETSEVYLAVASNEEAAEAKELGTTLGRFLFAQEMLEGLEDHSEAQGTETDFGNAKQTGSWTEWSTRPVLEIRREHDRRMDTLPKTGMDIPDHPAEARDDMGSPDLSEGRPGPDGPGGRENAGSPGLSAGGADQGEFGTAVNKDMEADTPMPGEKEADMKRAEPREAQPEVSEDVFGTEGSEFGPGRELPGQIQPEGTPPAEVPNEGKEDNQPFENGIPGFVGPASGMGSGDGPGGVGVTGHTDTGSLTEGNISEGGFGHGAGSLQGGPG